MPNVSAGTSCHGMIGASHAMLELFNLIDRLGPHAHTVLVSGETGTGKELVARALHAVGPRSGKPLVTINCAALVETVVESELFGHAKGAFTGAIEPKPGMFEVAQGATLFLDEVGELRPRTQSQLLRAVDCGEIQRIGELEPRQCDVAVIAATNTDLCEATASGRFRLDLLYRLGVRTLRVPPLRERRGDIPLLARAFVADMSRRLDREIAGFTPSAERRLQRADWPGNVRELRNVIERACLLTDHATISEGEVAMSMAARRASPLRHRPCRRRTDGSTNALATAYSRRIAAAPRLSVCLSPS